MINQTKFEMIDNFEQKIYIFGISFGGLLFSKYIQKRKEEIFFADNNRKFHNRAIIDGIKCVNPVNIDKGSLVVIAVESEKNIRDIVEQLEKIGLKNYTCLNFEELRLYQETIDMKSLIECLWFWKMDYELNWNKLCTMNEKMQWIKLNDKRPEYVLYADKYRVRDYIKEKFGEEYLIPLLYVTDDYKNLCKDNIPDEHCAIKSNCWSGDVEIVRSKESVDWNRLRNKFKKILRSDFSQIGGEWWYKYIKPCIVVEKLLETADGYIPNDYKLHFINGELQFIYCSIDRERENYRKIYSPEWEQLPFSWNGSSTPPDLKKKDIDCPKRFDDMLRMGKEISKSLPYVRVDYYEVEGRLYFGEITISHGAGFDHFIPQKYDEIYGQKLKLI